MEGRRTMWILFTIISRLTDETESVVSVPRQSTASSCLCWWAPGTS